MALGKTVRRDFRHWRARASLVLGLAVLGLTGAAMTSARAQVPGAASIFTTPSGFSSVAAAPAPASQVKAALLADVTAIAPGRPFRLGVRFTLQPGWHIYWINAGDAGQATRVEWRLPPGFTAEPLQWPLPRRIDQEGLVSYGYEGGVLLFATVHPPAALPAGPLKFSASTSWIACKEACIPGEAQAELTLAAGSPAASPAAPEFARAAAHVPVTLAQPRTDRISLEFSPSPLPLWPGADRRFEVAVQILAPWRLDAASDDGPAALYPVSSGAIETSHPQLLSAAPERVRFAWPLSVAKTAPTAGSQLRATLRLPLVNPATGERQLVAVTAPVPVAFSNSAPATPAVAAPTPAASASAPAAAPGGQELSFLKPGTAAHLPLWQLLLYAFLGGLILNIMPCVLPVLSLKVLAFVRQAGEDRRRVFLLGLAYLFGVLLSFAALAGAVIALRTFGIQVGQGFQLQEPRFIVIMAGVIMALGLSLLGVYSIELPGAAVGRLDQAARREGYLGALLSGMLSTALATPCTAPYLGSALGFAFTQPPALVMLFFLVTGLGLALPYLILSLNPGWLRFLPRSGRWMLVFEQLMGFVLLGFMVWLLSILGRLFSIPDRHQAGAAGIVATLAFLFAIAVACWVVGLAGQSRLTRPRWGLAVLAALALVIVAFFEFPERFLHQMNRETGGERVPAAAASAGEIPWEPFSVARVEQLVKEGRTVFVDFTADWCLTCKVNERGTLAAGKVRELFARHHVAALRADWTAPDETIRRVLAQFGQAGVPFYVVFPAGQPDRPRVLPTLLTVNAVEDALTR